MSPNPIAKTIVAVITDTNDYSATGAEVTTYRLDLIPTLQKTPLSAKWKNEKTTAPQKVILAIRYGHCSKNI